MWPLNKFRRSKQVVEVAPPPRSISGIYYRDSIKVKTTGIVDITWPYGTIKLKVVDSKELKYLKAGDRVEIWIIRETES